MQQHSIRLVEIYSELERILENGDDKYSPFSRRVKERAQRDPLFAQYRDDLLLLAELRNILVHNIYTDVYPVVYPNEKLLQRFEDILSHIKSPDTALGTIAVPLTKIYSVTPGTRVVDAVRYMYKNGYAHAPVLVDGRVQGVFSEQSLLAYAARHSGKAVFDENLKISEFTAELSFSEYKALRYAFVPKHASVYEVAACFDRSLSPRQHQSWSQTRVVFITDNGKQSGKLLGMVTPYNLVNYRW